MCNRLKTLLLLRIAGVVYSLSSTIAAMDIKDPAEDYAFVEAEPYLTFKTGQDNVTQKGVFPRLYSQMDFPAGQSAGHTLFGEIRAGWTDRDVLDKGVKLNNGPLQRYGLGFGGMLFEKEHHDAFVMGLAGLNIDRHEIGGNDWSSEWLAGYVFKPNKRLNFGGGLDLMRYQGGWFPYPLLLLDWRLYDTGKLRCNGDVLEFKQFFAPIFCLVTGLRYNFEYYTLKGGTEIQDDSIGAELGFEYMFLENAYARFRYKYVIWGEEQIKGQSTNSIQGNSLRLNIAYGI